MAPDKILYIAHASATGGRDGHATSDDGALNVKLGMPKELGGAGGAVTNPEQLFAAGYSACFLSTIKVFATQGKVSLPADAKVSAAVGVGPTATGYGLDIALQVTLPGMQTGIAQALIDQAHGACPYSNAVRGNVDVRLTLVV